MCESLADGGRRCAAHTRPAYEAAMARLGGATDPTEQAEARATGTGEVAAFASTRSGRPEVEQAFVAAELARDHETAAWLATALRIGDAQAQAALEIKRVIRAERETVPLG